MRNDMWIVGRIYNCDPWNWGFIGLYDSESLAVSACSTPNDFVGLAEVNVTLNDEKEEWPGSYFPKAG